jgi:hypothetical protein
MTPFEIIITVLVALVVLLVGFIAYRLDILMHNAIAFFIRTGKQLSSARADMYDDVGNHYLVEILNKLKNIEDDVLDDLRDIRLADKLGKTSPNVPASLPCYAPNGICTNPQMDCINCPKHGAGGVWSTSTNTINKD